MDSPFLGALLASLVAFTLVYVLMLRRRMELAELEDAFEEALATEDRAVAGAAVTAPRYDDHDGWEPADV
jgi:heme exporter protein C